MLEHSSEPRPSEYFNDLSYMDAGYLYYYTLDQISLSKERLGEDIERELQVRLIQSMRCIRLYIEIDSLARLPPAQRPRLPRRRRQGCTMV